MTTQNLLVELLTEELPPKALKKLGEEFSSHLVLQLVKAGLVKENPVYRAFATPRRLAVWVQDVLAVAPDEVVKEKILPVNVALDSAGLPSTALQKKLASFKVAGVTLDDLTREPDGKAESFFYEYTQAGVKLTDVLGSMITQTIAALPIPKVMTYQRPSDPTKKEDIIKFVRPAHRLVVLYGDQVVSCEVLGLASNRVTQGHRFMMQDGHREVAIAHADDYEEDLEKKGFVIASYDKRQAKIVEALQTAAKGLTILQPQSLLDEVNSLVEWPVVYACEFEKDFLKVPSECLILTMQTNQKYFALVDEHNKLSNRFLIVSNLATDTPEAIIAGNEKVVRPRLADAKFFFEQDCKTKLIDRLPRLGMVTYHNKLGTQLERSQRVEQLSENIAQLLKADSAKAKRAALLAKTDLLTDMVGEFPELQGIMGTYYANIDGEDSEVASSMQEQYQPRFAGDELPQTTTGTILALADKLETLVGIWGIGLVPTGDKDPFALRRHALGIIRILIEKNINLSVKDLLETASQAFAGQSHYQAALPAIENFMMDRLRGYLKDKGFSTQSIEAIVGQNPEYLDDVMPRLQAVVEFAKLPQAQSLAAANKRINNLLKNAGEVANNINEDLLKVEAEKLLYQQLLNVEKEVTAFYEKGDFVKSLNRLATLREPVDAFFTDVMVMDEDMAVRNNRLALLKRLHGLMNKVGDIGQLG